MWEAARIESALAAAGYLIIRGRVRLFHVDRTFFFGSLLFQARLSIDQRYDFGRLYLVQINSITFLSAPRLSFQLHPRNVRCELHAGANECNRNAVVYPFCS